MNNLINLTIDGKKIQAEKGKNLVDVAKDNGVEIPTLCYFKSINPTLGTCRICTVKLNGRHTTGCTAHVDEGMDVEIKIDAYNDKIFTGKIDFIYPAEEESQGITYYEIKITLSDEEIKNLNVLPGMSLEVFIVYSSKKDILSVKRGTAKMDEKG